MNSASIYKICLMIFLLFVASIYAQAPDTVWTKVYGGDHHELGECIRSTADGDYIIAGSNHTNSFGSYDVYLMKIDQAGDTLWTQHYGTIDTEMGAGVEETPDGSFIAVGNYDAYSPNSPRDIYLIKTDPEGNQLQSELLGGSGDDFASQIKKLPNGNYIIIGSYESSGSGNWDIWLLYLNSAGDTLWTKTIGDQNCQWGFSIDNTSEGDFIIGGSYNAMSVNGEDFYIVKVDGSGDTIWTKTYPSSGTDRICDIQATPDGGCVAVGFLGSRSRPLWSIFVLRTDSNGDTLWTRRYGGEIESRAASVIINNESNYVIAGYKEYADPDLINAYILCLNPDGDSLWSKSLARGLWTEANSLIQTSDGGYILTGQTKNYYEEDWELDLYIARLTPEITAINSGIRPQVVQLVYNYPNPFNTSTSIQYNLPHASAVTLDIYNILGRKVRTFYNGYQPAGSHSVIWDADDLSSGVYFYRLTAGENIMTKRMTLIK
jgi:hypothetical protein